MLCYHGTSADNLESILKNGLSCSESKVWTVSHDAVYCWTIDLIKAEYPECIDDEIDIDYRLRTQAFDSATAALAQAKDCRAVIVIFEVPDEELEPDNSCNIEMNANCIRRDIAPNEIKTILLSNDLSLIRGQFIAQMLDRELSNLYFSDLEVKIGKAFQLAEIYAEDYEDSIEWTEVSLGDK